MHSANHNIASLNIAQIASVIRQDWKNVSPHAKPYLDAMRHLYLMTDKFGMDDAKGIILYFLGNASTWRGDTAKLVKAELKRRCQSA